MPCIRNTRELQRYSELVAHRVIGFVEDYVTKEDLETQLEQDLKEFIADEVLHALVEVQTNILTNR